MMTPSAGASAVSTTPAQVPDSAVPAIAPAAAPQPRLSTLDAIAIVVGIIIGAGIFSAPSIVAASVSSPLAFLAAWMLGGLVSFVGALCYAELASTYPDAGGDYHFLHRSYGPSFAFLFAWARLAVIQTGSIAIQAFIIGDYASKLLDLGPYSSSLYAAAVVVLFTALNVAGVRQGTFTQKFLTAFKILAIAAVTIAGFAAAQSGRAVPSVPSPSRPAFGLAMVLVLLTYGGWSEAAYLSAELKGTRRTVVRVLAWSLGVVTAVYLLTNAAYLLGLGLTGLAQSHAPAADLLNRVAGATGAKVIGLMIVITAAAAANGTIFTGARTNYALGRDFSLLAPLGRWNGRAGTPTNALLLQGVITLGLIGFGAIKRNGFQTMVEYTAPVFWFFLLMIAIAVFVLRYRDPVAPRPFVVPLYPLTPIIFCAACAYMLYASLSYTGAGALVGVAVLVIGLPLMLLARLTGRAAILNPKEDR